MDNRPIGVFDSGVGGISLMRNMLRLLPKESFIYYGDEANAPYGTKPEAEILALARADAQLLLDLNVKALVIACNTATSAAAKQLRSEMSLPIIGIEPALKPAALDYTEGPIAVLATPATLRQQKFANLMQLYGEHAFIQPCPGLMEFVERGITQGGELDAFLDELLYKLKAQNPRAVVLGCTHYSFVAGAIAKALPGARLYDGNEGTARQLARVLERENLLCGKGEGSVTLLTSGDPDTAIPLMKKLLVAPIAI